MSPTRLFLFLVVLVASASAQPVQFPPGVADTFWPSSLFGISQQQGLKPPPPPKSLGFQLGDEDFLPFQNFRYEGEVFYDGDTRGVRTVASLGMVHWTHRYNLKRKRTESAGRHLPRLANISRSESRKYSILDSLNRKTEFVFSEDPMAFQEQLVRRLEAKDTRQLSFVVRSQNGLRERHLFVYAAERTDSGIWTCSFYDPHIPEASTLRYRGKLRFLPGYLGYSGDGDQARGPPAGVVDALDREAERRSVARLVTKAGIFQVSAAWAAAANRPSSKPWSEDGVEETDPFTNPVSEALGKNNQSYVRLELKQVGVADASAKVGWKLAEDPRALRFAPREEAVYGAGPRSDSGVFDSAEGYVHFSDSFYDWIAGRGRGGGIDPYFVVAILDGDQAYVLHAIISKLKAAALRYVVYEVGEWLYLVVQPSEVDLTEEEEFFRREKVRKVLQAAENTGHKVRQAYRMARAATRVSRDAQARRAEAENQQVYRISSDLDTALEANGRDRDQLGELKVDETYCFIAGTQVLTKDGRKSIEEIEVGDLVFAKRPVANKDGPATRLRWNAVADTIQKMAPETVVVELLGSGGRVLEGTAEHPVWVSPARGWVPLGELKAGDEILGPGGSRSEVRKRRIKPGPVAVYNLTVEGLHTFIVAVGDARVLVHNADCGSNDKPIPSRVFRQGKPNPGNFKPRPQDNGNLSFRDSLTNPIDPATGKPFGGGRPVFEPGKPFIEIDTSKLPPGSVIPDGAPGSSLPPGHVSINGVPAEVLQDAVINRDKFPK